MKLSYFDLQGNLFHEYFENPLIRIGRYSDMDLCINNPTVSGRHANIFLFNGNPTLIDLKSTNGTFLNGISINRQILKPGDHIQFGEFSIWFELIAIAKSGVRKQIISPT